MTTYTSEPGTRLGGRYRLEDRTAAGSGWDAWKAIDETLARAVTVITFAQGFPRIAEVVTAARAASRLTDPRLAQVFDVEDAWDRAYVVMEWAAGESLGDLLSSGPIEPARSARMISEAAAALASAHAAGVAHMCLSPSSVKWSQTGEVKVTGLGVDAALAGMTAEDPVLADTRSLGDLLYAALTGCWPGPDYPSLPPAPLADGQPRSPRQVLAGIPATFSDLTCRAMQIPVHSGPPITSPGELSAALVAVLPPTPVPSAPPPPAPRERPVDDGADPYWPGRQRNDWQGQDATGWPREGASYQDTDSSRYGYGVGPAPAGRAPERAGHRASPARGRRGQRALPFMAGRRLPVAVLAGVGALAVVAAVTAIVLWPSGSKPPAVEPKPGKPTPAAAITALLPERATGFDPLTSQQLDPYNENSQYANLAIDGSAQTAWTTQWYKTDEFGGLKTGSGLMIEMPKAETYRSVVVTFGTEAGSDVKILVGNSAARSAANLASMTTVASGTNVTGNVTFSITSSARGRYLVIWFTKLPPKPGKGHWFAGQIFNVTVRGIG
jgi:serine/threonine protein kinase